MFNDQRRKDLAEAGFPQVPEDQLMILEDYLDISRRRHLTFMPMFKLQLHMLQDLVIAQKTIGSYKLKMKEFSDISEPPDGLDTAVDDLDERSPNAGTSADPEAKKRSAAHRAIRRELYFLKSEVRGLRDIADGIAWRLFDYDRAVLHELSRRPHRSHINSEGLLAELYRFASYFNERSGVAVLNDLTNFLKFGDVTVRRGSDDFEIVEVKAGTSGSGRLTRQRQGLNEVVSLLSVDEGREIAGAPVRISSVDVTPEMFIGNLRSLLDRAKVDGGAVESIGSHLIIQCIDFMAVRSRELDKEKVFGILDRGEALLRRWNAANDFVLPLDIHQRYVHAQNYVPLSIFPLEPKTCVRLLSGTVSLISFLNVSAVLRELETRGWKVAKSPFELTESVEALDAIGRETPIAVLQKGPLTTSVPASLFGRIGMEFLKPKSLAQLLDAVFERRAEGGYQFVNFAGESRMWT